MRKRFRSSDLAGSGSVSEGFPCDLIPLHVLRLALHRFEQSVTLRLQFLIDDLV